MVNGYVTLLFDIDRLIVSVKGYLYCLDPSNGTQLWYNPTKDCGYGVASIATFRSCTPHEAVIGAIRKRREHDDAMDGHNRTT